jgi:hypothetical protein
MSKTQIGIGEAVGLILGLIGVGIQMLWPEQKWLGWVFIGLGVAIGVFLLIWMWAQHVAVREIQKGQSLSLSQVPANQTQSQYAPISFAPVLNQITTQTQTQSQAQTSTQSKQYELPEIECPDVYYKDVWLNRWEAILDTYSSEAVGPQRKAAFADIYFKPILESDPHLYLRSEICFFDAVNNSRLRRVKDGIWDCSDKGSEYIRPGETKTIVVLVVVNEAFTTYEHGIMQINQPNRFRSREVLAPILEILPAQNLYAQIRIIGKRGGDLRLNQEFWFHLERLDGELLIAQIAPPFRL